MDSQKGNGGEIVSIEQAHEEIICAFLVSGIVWHNRMDFFFKLSKKS